MILSFGGVEKREFLTNLTVDTYNSKLIVGDGFSGYMSDLKITRTKGSIEYFKEQYKTNNCPTNCPLQCRKDNTCDFTCDQ